MELKDMKSESKKKDVMELEDHRPEYPYGLRIDLNNESLDKLGIKELPEIGETMVMMAKVEVVSVGSHAHKGGDKHRNVDLQITEMGFEGKKISQDEALFGDKE